MPFTGAWMSFMDVVGIGAGKNDWCYAMIGVLLGQSDNLQNGVASRTFFVPSRTPSTGGVLVLRVVSQLGWLPQRGKNLLGELSPGQQSVVLQLRRSTDR